MNNVTKFYAKGSSEFPNAILEQAIGKYEEVLILGYDKDGFMDVRATTSLKKADLLWLINIFEHKLMRGDYDAP